MNGKRLNVSWKIPIHDIPRSGINKLVLNSLSSTQCKPRLTVYVVYVGRLDKQHKPFLQCCRKKQEEFIETVNATGEVIKLFQVGRSVGQRGSCR